jgi:hypothetical protein
MKEIEKATPRPWVEGENIKFRLMTDVCGRGGEDYIADCGMLNGLSAVQCEANAALIVKAVNALDRHLAIIKQLREALQGLEPYLSTEEQMLDYASLNDGRASGFGVASLNARAALKAFADATSETYPRGR